MSSGDLVVCVNTGIIPGARNEHLHCLREGDIYTIEDVCIRERCGRNEVGIKIVEIRIDANDWWHSARFRSCRKTDISAITACVKEREKVEHG